MLFKTLFSGSSGNCSYLKAGSTEILIDAGGSTRRIESALKALDTDLNNIDAIYITHEHSDHIAALPVLLKSFKIPLYVTPESAREMYREANDATRVFLREQIYTIQPGKVYKTGDFSLIPFRTPHDSVMSVGYRICVDGGECLGYATDTGHVTDTMREFLLGCKRVVVESNHDVQMLKNGPYPPFLKKRILSENGHLSNSDCANFLCELVEHGCESIMLAHLSKENNTPAAAYEVSEKTLEAYGIRVNKDVTLAVAAEKCICDVCST